MLAVTILYRAAIDQALAEGSVFDPFQRASHLIEYRQIDIFFLKLTIVLFVSDTRVAPVTEQF